MKKPILYFDMDNVLVNFKSGIDATNTDVLAQYADDGKGNPHYDDIPGIFAKMLHPFYVSMEKSDSAEREVGLGETLFR